MSNIEEIAVQTYQENIQYFLGEQPELYKLLEYFNTAIDNGDYSSNYDLEYTSDNYFDIIDNKNKKLFYGTNSKEYSKDLIKDINYKKDLNLFEATLDCNLNDDEAFQKDADKIIAEVLPIMSYVKDNTNDKMDMIKINKFIIIGTGLGMQITELQKNLDIDEFLIIEDDLELFKLSLFTTSYKQISTKASLSFAVAQDDNMFLTTMRSFLSTTFYNNRYIKYLHFPIHTKNKIKHIQNAIATQSHLVFPYSMALDKFTKPLEYMGNSFNILDISKRYEKSIFSHKPVLVLGAGPSLNKNIEFVKENKNKFIIACVSATLKTLHKYGIKPDIVSHIDGIESKANSCMVHYDGFDAKEFLKDTNLLFGPFTPKALRDMFSKDNIFLYQDGENYFSGFGSLSAPCVGTTTLALMLIFNTKDLYLLGLDLALDQETGETHSDEHTYNKQHDLSDTSQLNENISLTDNIITVKGNFTDTVLTTPMLHLSVQVMYSMLPIYKDKAQNIYNLSLGAHFPKTIPTNLTSIKSKSFETIDKDKIFKSINSLFKNNSVSEISKKDFETIKNRLAHTKSTIKILENYKSMITYTSTNNYLYEMLGLLKELTLKSKSSSSLSYVLYSYFEYTLPFIFDMLNTKELKHEQRHLKSLDTNLTNGLSKIIQKYELSLEQFLNSYKEGV